MSNTVMTDAIPAKNTVLASEGGAREFGTFSALGTGYGKIIANFYYNNQNYSVAVPANLESLCMAAIVNKLTVLASFETALGQPNNSITDIIIYN